MHIMCLKHTCKHAGACHDTLICYLMLLYQCHAVIWAVIMLVCQCTPYHDPMYMSVHMSVQMSVCMLVHQSICRAMQMPMSMPIHIPDHVSHHMPNCLPVQMSMHMPKLHAYTPCSKQGLRSNSLLHSSQTPSCAMPPLYCTGCSDLQQQLF